MGRRCDGGCQEAGGEKLKECCKELGQLAEDSQEGLGSKRAVVPMMMMILFVKLFHLHKVLFESLAFRVGIFY